MTNNEWNDYGAITGPLIVTIVLLVLAFAPVLDSKMWQSIKDLMSIVTPAMAALVAYFAYRISRQQLRIARFEKRHVVYASVMDLISACLSRTVKDHDIRAFRVATASAEFLFDRNQTVANYVERLRREATEFVLLLTISRALNDENLKAGPDRMSDDQARETQENNKKIAQLSDWFEKQY